MRILLLISAFAFPSLATTTFAADHYFDVVVYGGTSAAVTTAVQIKKMGKRVVIVSPDKHLGGLSSGGLGWTDSGNKDAIGGLSREFYHRVWKRYQNPSAWRWQPREEFGNRNQSPPGKRGDGATMWVFEPHVAERIFDEMVGERLIPVHRGQWLDRGPGGVLNQDGYIESLRTLSGDRYIAQMYIDATYEGDLMAAAKVKYHVGREANTVYGETWNGVQVGTLHHSHYFAKPVDPYVIAGEPDSGLLPRISGDPPGIKGEGDHRVQAYCFRMCLTNHNENRIPFTKPQPYDASQYELLLRVFDSGWRQLFNKFDPLPNYKTDTNNHGPFSTDNIGMNYDYPEASYERRAEIVREHENYQKGLMYFMANDPRVPTDVREAMKKWGLAKDEFTDNDGWPHQIYVREARRMIGSYVMTEHDCLDRKATPESIGMGSYTLDSHNVQRYVTPDGHVQNEGDIGVKTPAPYEIAYGAITPRKTECQNLLVPVCVSSSHIAFGSIRMEPVFMILGQSAGTAACLAIDRHCAVQDVPYPILKERMLSDGQVLELEHSYPISSEKLPGVVVDDRAAKVEGGWKSSTANQKFVDGGYIHNDNSLPGEKSVTFETQLAAGKYDVRISYPSNNNRATHVPVVVIHADGESRVHIDQTQAPEIDGLFSSIGEFRFSGKAIVCVETDSTDGYVIADAVQFLPVKD